MNTNLTYLKKKVWSVVPNRVIRIELYQLYSDKSP